MLLVNPLTLNYIHVPYHLMYLSLCDHGVSVQTPNSVRYAGGPRHDSGGQVGAKPSTNHVAGGPDGTNWGFNWPLFGVAWMKEEPRSPKECSL